MVNCTKCGEDTVLKVGKHTEFDGNLYACCNEDCTEYAELLIYVNGILVSLPDMLNVYKEIVKEVTDEKNKVSES